MPELLTGAQIICRVLEEEGVDVLFGYPGGAIMPFYHALPEFPGLRHILVRHEQAAAHAADGYARASGRPGVCVATSGPGATNLVTGLAAAHMDNSPVVAITGQVRSHLIGTDAFQEVDIFGITLPIVKHSYVLRDATQIVATVREAFRIARDGRPGPVLIDLPKDIANAPAEWPGPAAVTGEVGKPLDHAAIQRARTLIQSSRQPLFYTGYGVGLAGAETALRAVVDATGIPVVSKLGESRLNFGVQIDF